MKIIICGAGQVGFSIARHLSAEDNDVIIVDQSEELVRKITNNLEVQGIVGFASRPDVLKQAGASEADMLVAVTASDAPACFKTSGRDANPTMPCTSRLLVILRTSSSD
jgi:trk system potassium uptake protein TrkA